MTRKITFENLAIHGGAPFFGEPVHVGKPNIPPQEALLAKIASALDRAWLSNNGPLVQEFESILAKYLGVEHCIAICNATRALEIVTRAMDVKGEVIVPSFTFIATPHSLQWQEITPVFSDINPATHSLDPAQIERHITPRTTAIMPVHVWGLSCDTDAIEAIAKKHKLAVIYDSSHAFGCSHKGKMIGTFGDAEVFSFHATKVLNTFEGGVITTNNAGLAKKIRLMKNFGFAGKDSVIHIGTNGKMSEISAAMGLVSMEYLGDYIATNKKNFLCYKEQFASTAGVRLIEPQRGNESNYHYIILELDPSLSGSRDKIVKVLEAENVLARRYFYPGCHNMEPYRSLYPYAGMLLPVTEAMCHRVICLPNGVSVNRESIGAIADIIKIALQNRDKL